MGTTTTFLYELHHMEAGSEGHPPDDRARRATNELRQRNDGVLPGRAVLFPWGHGAMGPWGALGGSVGGVRTYVKSHTALANMSALTAKGEQAAHGCGRDAER